MYIMQGVKTFKLERLKLPALVAIKEDGLRGRYNRIDFRSTIDNHFSGLQHLEVQLQGFTNLLDGELTIPGMEFNKASGKIRSYDSAPNVVYNVFDIPSAKLTKAERYKLLVKLFRSSVIGSDSIRLIKHHWVNTFQELMDFYYHVISLGHEGIVIYNPASMYTDGKNYAWMRMIPEPTADCECIGFYEGTKGLAHEGSLGGIYVDFNGVKCKVGTGFKSVFEGNEPETVRQNIWDNQDMFLGVIAECAYKDITPYKKMRQPRFKTWRWDKI